MIQLLFIIKCKFIHNSNKRNAISSPQTEDQIRDPSTVRQSIQDEQDSSQSNEKSTVRNDDPIKESIPKLKNINDEPFNGTQNQTEDLDDCFIFSLIGNINQWKTRISNLKYGDNKNIQFGEMVLKIPQSTLYSDISGMIQNLLIALKIFNVYSE